jgi:hypothetical protein
MKKLLTAADLIRDSRLHANAVLVSILLAGFASRAKWGLARGAAHGVDSNEWKLLEDRILVL